MFCKNRICKKWRHLKFSSNHCFHKRHSSSRILVSTALHSVKTRMDFLLLPVVPWPTVYSMVNVHQWSNPSSTVSLNGPNVYSHVWFQIHSPSPTTNLPARISWSHCCVMASPGTLTKTSSSATPEWETWRSIKSLKVKWKEEKNIWVFLLHFSFFLLLGCWFFRYYASTILAETSEWAGSRWSNQQWIHQRWSNCVDERSSLPQL